MANKKDANKDGNAISYLHTDANPEVVSADLLPKTQAEEREEVEKHDEFTQATGVLAEELDTRPVVDTGEVEGTFDERTTGEAPWAEYQRESSRKVATDKSTKKDTK